MRKATDDRKGATPHEEDESDEIPEPLHWAARRGDASRCAELLALLSPSEVDARDADGHTALHWACDVGCVEVAQKLLELGSDPNAQNDDGSTALHMACARDFFEIASLLIKSGADVHRVDTDGCAPLEFSSQKLLEQVQPIIEP